MLVQASTQPVLKLYAVPLLLVTGTYLLSTYANYRVKGRPVVVIAALDGLRIFVAIVIVGAVLDHSFI